MPTETETGRKSIKYKDLVQELPKPQLTSLLIATQEAYESGFFLPPDNQQVLDIIRVNSSRPFFQLKWYGPTVRQFSSDHVHLLSPTIAHPPSNDSGNYFPSFAETSSFLEAKFYATIDIDGNITCDDSLYKQELSAHRRYLFGSRTRNNVGEYGPIF